MTSQAQLTSRLRRHVICELYDESGHPGPGGFAIYSLADPRDLRVSRYIGQTALPARRFRQHLDQARLGTPAQMPWWIRQPRLRPLYEWLRALYQDEGRLPTMLIHAWVETAAAARVAERTRIMELLARDLPLLNIERELLDRQRALL